MSNLSLLRLFDSFLLPFVLIFGVKYLTALILNLLMALDWEFSFSVFQLFSLPFIHYSNGEDLLLVNSVSSLIMSLALAVGFTFVLYRFQFFHKDFVPPKIASKLHSKQLDRFIISDNQAHNQLTIWFTLAWITFLVILLEFLGGTVGLLVLIINLTIVSLLSVVLIFDMFRKGSTVKAGYR